MKPPAIGELKCFLTFRSVTESRGADGSVIETFDVLANKWARMMPVSGGERYTSQQIMARVVYEVWCRWFSGLTSQSDFTFNGRSFKIESVRNYDEANIWWVILATEDL